MKQLGESGLQILIVILWTSLQSAKDSCFSSKLGMCDFTTDSTASNGFGLCKVKEEFKKGIAKDCDTDCASCGYTGNFKSSEADKKPSYYCKNSKAKCKWVADLSNQNDESKGKCVSNSEKTCEDRCDECNDESECTNFGAKKGNTSKATQCSWDSVSSTCSLTTGGAQKEICWDGIDNNNNGKMDCADSMCFSDTFCGGTFMVGFGGKDCFGYSDQASCNSNQCVWMSENWGEWCDMPGASCWKKDGNQNNCAADGNCTWHSGFGGFCEENWTMSGNCMGKTEPQCREANTTGCVWTVDQFFQGFAGGQQGWCDPDWSFTGTWVDNFCAGYDDNGRTDCEDAGTADSAGKKPCNWFNSTSSSGAGAYGGGWCDHMKFACGQFNTEANCTQRINDSQNYNHSQYCNWKHDEWGTFCEGKSMGGSSVGCWGNADQNSCTTAGCNWKSGFCDPVGFGSEMGGGGMAGGAIMSMGGSGMSCFKYNGNQTGCAGQQGCGWMEELQPFCDVDKGTECPQYSYSAAVCNSKSRCVYNAQMQFCDEKPFACNWNSSYSNGIDDANIAGTTDQAECQSNSLCYWSNIGCQPQCFNSSKSTSATCGGFALNATNGTLNQSACTWVSGWCNSGIESSYFQGMEKGAPTPLGSDVGGDASPAEVDIIDFGMKEMGFGDTFGFGN
ncbi:hypothetical protein HYU21_02770 [Candidatus Woesearchaeota archaeon]|nr:hypothetical protein [Candidatus Woesearchaeota archaeon]